MLSLDIRARFPGCEQHGNFLTALELLERLVQAEWARDDLERASALPDEEQAPDREQLDKLAETQWKDAISGAIAFLGVQRAQDLTVNPGAGKDPAAAEAAREARAAQLAGFMEEAGLCLCPACGSCVEVERLTDPNDEELAMAQGEPASEERAS